MEYDVLVRNGLLIDPFQGIYEKYDVAFSEGKVAAVEKSISGSAKHVIDAEGKIVTPGVIDLHVHVYYGVASRLGIDPDSTCLMKGATTVLDAGTAGHVVFPGFRKFVIERARTKIYALVNIGALGLIGFGYPNVEKAMKNMDFIDIEETVKCIEQNRDIIKGIKWHRTYGQETLVLAKWAAEKAGCFLMCENSALHYLPVEIVLRYMRPGDILTHCFHGGPASTVLDEDGRVRPEVEKAARRGIIFDIGHGMASFSFEVAEKAISQGLLPTTISTDLHYFNVNGPVYDIGTTMSKFLFLGLSLEQVVERVTSKPAEILGILPERGTLRPGAVGDCVVWDLREGRFEFEDSLGEKRIGEKLLKPLAVISGGELIHKST